MNLKNLPQHMANDYHAAMKVVKQVPPTIKIIGQAIAHIPAAFVSTPGLKQKKASKK